LRVGVRVGVMAGRHTPHICVWGSVWYSTGLNQFHAVLLTAQNTKTGTGVKSNPPKLELAVPVLHWYSSVQSRFFSGFEY
jgi:hypothetical protein